MRKTIDELQPHYDAVVIGCGLGGLTAANVLAKNGLKVCLAEQHFQLGGLASYFKRKGHIFDVALHGFPVGMKKTLRKYWSKEMAEHITQVRSVRFDNPQFSLETDFTETDFTQILIEKFGQPEERVRAFYKELAEMNFYDENTMRNRELFAKYFPGRNDVMRLLMEPITYANGSTLDEQAITYGIVFSNFMSQGVFTFSGGTDLMLEMMEDCLHANGVDLALRAPVTKIHTEHGKVTGVTINGRFIGCRAVISNGNLIKTIRDWVGDNAFSPDFLSAVKAVKVNTSSCQVYMGLKPDEKIDYIGDLLFTSTHPEYDPEALLSADITSRTYSVYYPEIRPQNKPDYTLVASMNARWENWQFETRAAYEAAKRKMIEETINHAEHYIPGLRDKLDYVDAATPSTFERYTLHSRGAAFGTKFEGLDISMHLSQQVAGLFHTGSVGIIMSGWLGAANYGVIVANQAMKTLF